MAPTMAAIALAESGGRTDAHNATPPDDSYGLYQINYYSSLAPSRTAAYGSPAQLVADPNLQAKAAIAISGNGSNLKPWSTYTNGSYKRFLSQDTGNILAPGGATLSPAPPQAPGASSGTIGGGGDEGEIAMPSIIPNIPRSGIRKVVGGAVLVAGAVVGLAGLFLLVGSTRRLPGPAGVVQGIVSQRAQTTRTRMSQEGRLQRQQEAAAERRSRQLVDNTPGGEAF